MPPCCSHHWQSASMLHFLPDPEWYHKLIRDTKRNDASLFPAWTSCGSDSDSFHVKNTSNLFRLIRWTSLFSPSVSLASLLSHHPHMQESIIVAIKRDEAPPAVAARSAFTAIIRLRVKEHLLWNCVAVDRPVTKGSAATAAAITPPSPLFVLTAGSEPHNCTISAWNLPPHLCLTAHPVTLRVLGEAAETERCKNRSGRSGCRLDTAGRPVQSRSPGRRRDETARGWMY